MCKGSCGWVYAVYALYVLSGLLTNQRIGGSNAANGEFVEFYQDDVAFGVDDPEPLVCTGNIIGYKRNFLFIKIAFHLIKIFQTQTQIGTAGGVLGSIIFFQSQHRINIELKLQKIFGVDHRFTQCECVPVETPAAVDIFDRENNFALHDITCLNLMTDHLIDHQSFTLLLRLEDQFDQFGGTAQLFMGDNDIGFAV